MLNRTIQLRASATPLAFLCPGSVEAPTVRVEEVGEAANLGSAGHEAFRPLAENGAVDWASLPEIATRWDVDGDELRMLCAMATRLWVAVGETFRGALTEVPLSAEVLPGVVLTGHVDLVASAGTVARIADWKTGRKDSDYSHQMRAYGTLMLLDDPSLTEVTVTVLWVRDGEIENYTLTREAMAVWLGELRERVVEWNGTYRTGPHCEHCKRWHECGPATALVRRDVAMLLDVDAAAAIAAMPPAQLIELHRKASLVGRLADRVRDAIKAHVVASGDVESEDARLTIAVEERRTLDPAAAWPVLEAEGFGDEDFGAVVELRVSKVEKRVAEKAGRGKGAGAVRALSARLADAGAVKTREVHKLVEKRKAG